MSKKLCCWTSVLLSCAAIAAHAEEGITLSIEMLNWQKSCPVQIVAVNTAKVGWFINDALVLNTTQSDVQEIQLGLVLSRSNGDNLNQRRLRTFIGYRVPVAIAPGEAVATGPQLWTVGA
ncbi:MAG: hypothetical protein FJW35_12540, partial [Acidobacteria bacterium]|nr:hypothetical protein [Acidobacteriota bacterium]